MISTEITPKQYNQWIISNSIITIIGEVWRNTYFVLWLLPRYFKRANSASFEILWCIALITKLHDYDYYSLLPTIAYITQPYISLHQPTQPYMSLHKPWIAIHMPTQTYTTLHRPTSAYNSLHRHTQTYIAKHNPTLAYTELHRPT